MSDTPTPSLNAWISSAVKNNKSLPSAENLAKWAKVDVESAAKAIDNWKEREGFKEPVKASEPKQEPVAVAKVEEPKEVVKEPEEKKAFSIHELPHGIVRAGMGLIAISCSVWAWENVRLFFSFAPGWEYLIATVITGILFIFPQASPLLPKGSITKALVWPSFAAALIMCMVTTVSANYTNRADLMQSMLQARSASESARDDAEDSKADKKRLEGLQDADSKELAAVRTAISSCEYGSKQYWSLDYKRSKLEKSVATYQQKIDALANRVEERRGVATKVVRKDFYSWVEGVTGWKAEAVEFWVGMIPPLIVDVAGPIAGRLALFL